MKLNLNDFDFDEFDELPQKQKLVKKKKTDTASDDKKKNDTYKKHRKNKDLDVLF